RSPAVGRARTGPGIRCCIPSVAPCRKVGVFAFETRASRVRNATRGIARLWNMPPGRADRKVEIAPRRLPAPGVPESQTSVGKRQESLARREVRLPVVARLGPKDRVARMLCP